MTETNPPTAPPMTPGVYLRKRREAAKLTIDQVALLIGGAGGADDAKAQLAAIEDGTSEIGLRFVGRLCSVFSFDLEVLSVLELHSADPQSEIPVPLICGRCGCTWDDACELPDGSFCAWSEAGTPQAPVCTAHDGTEPGDGEQLPEAAANDGEARDAA